MTDWSDKTVIVVPCYESQRFDASAFRAFALRRPKLTFLLVNDGSTDQTAQLIEHLQRTAPRSFNTLHLPCNCGKAEAVRRGMLQAFDMHARFVGFWDADLATPLETIDAFCNVLQRNCEIEMVLGSRLCLLGHRIQRSVIRRWLGRTFAFVASLCLGLRVRDTQCGAKLFRSSALTRSLFQEPFLSRWIFDVELLAKLANARRHFDLPQLAEMIYECPLDQWREVSGGSIKGRDFGRAIVDLAAIYWHYLRPGAAAVPVACHDHASNRDDPATTVTGQHHDDRERRAA